MLSFFMALEMIAVALSECVTCHMEMGKHVCVRKCGRGDEYDQC